MLLNCRSGKVKSQVYTFSSPPTVIEAPRIRVSPPRPTDALQKPVLDIPVQPGARNLSITDDSGTECELNGSQTTAASVSSAKRSAEKLLAVSDSEQSPLRQSVLRSSLREIPQDELRRSGVRNSVTFKVGLGRLANWTCKTIYLYILSLTTGNQTLLRLLL